MIAIFQGFHENLVVVIHQVYHREKAATMESDLQVQNGREGTGCAPLPCSILCSLHIVSLEPSGFGTMWRGDAHGFDGPMFLWIQLPVLCENWPARSFDGVFNSIEGLWRTGFVADDRRKGGV
jgi:hypothetical protein